MTDTDPTKAAIEAMAKAGAEKYWRMGELHESITWETAPQHIRDNWILIFETAFHAQNSIVRVEDGITAANADGDLTRQEK